MNSSLGYLQGVSRLFADQGPPIMHGFVAKHGREFELKTTAESGRSPMGKCYRNATELCILKGYEYVEGWAVPEGLMPIEHAWCYDPVDKKVIDPTWKDGGDYFGVVMDLRRVSELALEFGYYGVAGNLFRMRKPPAEVMARLESLIWRPPTKIGEQLSLGEKVY